MGYTTDFTRKVKVSPPLNEDEISFLEDFNRQRHFKRHGGPLSLASDKPAEAIDYNSTPPEIPGLWMQWIPADEGASIVWDGNEKFYYSEEWMRFLIEYLFSDKAKEYIAYWGSIDGADPRLKNFTCNHVFTGTIYAQGEIKEDKWKLRVRNNEVSAIYCKNNPHAPKAQATP